ncbi:GNAT family N-acetyltransferase [Nocardia sp. SSK8]|uniref:GNAT family N-acetyltransferase n=1 Tax=Nocardia sp. SSK8 TaxID=3120154 RepID=UPI00300A897D
MRIDITGDATRFLTQAETFLRGDPLRYTVVATVAVSQSRNNTAGTRFLTVRDDDGVRGIAQCTADGRAYLAAVPPEGIPAVVEVLMGLDTPLVSVEGPAAEIEAFLTHWPGTHERGHTARLFELGALRTPEVPGTPRLAGPGDLDVGLRMVQEFHAETGSPRGVARGVAERQIAAGLWWLWERDGVASAFVARQTEAFGWARIGPVYTPPSLRGNGYASALTAAVCGVIRAEGTEVCLFADLANPTSNKIYRAIGFAPVCDFVHHRLAA